MNKFDITGVTRGFPLKLDDIDFMNEANFEVLKALSSIYGENYILSGCEIDRATGNVSEGYVVLNNEVFKVDNHLLESRAFVSISEPAGSKDFSGSVDQSFDLSFNYWEVVQSQPSTGLRNLKYGGTHNAHKVRKARVYSAAQSYIGAIAYINTPLVTDSIYNQLKASIHSGIENHIESKFIQHNVTSSDLFNSNHGYSVGINGNDFLVERNLVTGAILYRVSFNSPVSTGSKTGVDDITVTYLPEDFRPSLQTILYCKNHQINIYTDGRVTYDRFVTGSDGAVKISGFGFAKWT